MKKVALSLASVLAAAAFAPEASAIPAFARQTGMACNACHQTHFPVLNGFGRAFKSAGYTMMGAQEKVEGEHLSIPGTLNAALLLKYRYQKQNLDGYTTPATVGNTAQPTPADGQVQMGDEFSLFFGGRIAETENMTIGFLLENNLGAAGAMPLLAGLRVPVSIPMGVADLQVVPFTTDSLGVAYGFELSSGGIQRASRWNEMRRVISAVQYNADRGVDGGAAAGTAFVLKNDMFFVNLTKWSSSFAPGANGNAVPSTNFGQTYLRAAVTPTVGDWNILAGVGQESGTSFGNLAGVRIEAKQTFVDVQAHGQIAGMESGIYLQNANAPVCDLAANCAHNGGAVARTATTIGAEMTVVPHSLILAAAIRNAQNGKVDAQGANITDNAVLVGGIYELMQNVELHFNYVSYSGTATDTANAANPLKSEYLGMLEMAW